MTPLVKRTTIAVSLATILTVGVVTSQVIFKSNRRPGWNADKTQYLMPNNWVVSPVGRSVDLPGDMPGTIVLTEDGKHALVNTCGFHDHSLNLVELATMSIVATSKVTRGWIGLASEADGSVLMSGGKADDPKKADMVERFRLDGGQFVKVGAIDADGVDPKDRFVSSILVGPAGTYVLNVQSDEVFLLSSSGRRLARARVGYRPYACALSNDGKTLAVTNWGDQSVSLLDSQTLKEKGRIAVGQHPTAVVAGPDGRWFVTDAGSDTVHILGGDKSEVVRVGLDQSQPIGPTPVAAVLDSATKWLYVANAGENTIAVLDVKQSGATKVLGHIPTDRYPTALALTRSGDILVGTAKGRYGPNSSDTSSMRTTRTDDVDKNKYTYVGDQLTGRLALVKRPSVAELQKLSTLAKRNLPRGESEFSDSQSSAIRDGALRKIKHVIYVIKENRTFDQVFGDMSRGERDPSLTIFGQQVTPNQHKLADTFVLLDNLYTDGDTSQGGHQWTDAAYANDYCEKQWILNYGRHGEVVSDMRLTSSPGEYIWSLARKKGLRARVYGEYVDRQEDHDSLSEPLAKADPEKYGYSKEVEDIFARGGRDTEKVDVLLREMREAERTGKPWQNLMVIALPDDHTHGMSAGAYSPRAMVGCNDLAVGKLVEGVSHSKFWKETAIFVIQDDAQSGPDHIDSHRTVGQVVSPYVKRGALVSEHYTTASMLRTMEIMLGLPPMTTFDAKARPMYKVFTTNPDFTPYSALEPGVDIMERNPAKTALALRSAKLDWSDVDKADWAELNRILWEAYKPGVPYPKTPGNR
ncbi:MAG: hypothetical protein JSS65_09550 [Armatimonadetes bacterium]|nr:hypothetical protein [Armatimonadota bacterium]